MPQSRIFCVGRGVMEEDFKTLHGKKTRFSAWLDFVNFYSQFGPKKIAPSGAQVSTIRLSSNFMEIIF